MRDNVPGVPINIEDLLSQVELHAAADGDPAVIADLWTQAQLLQVR